MEQKEKEYQERQQEILKEEEAKREAEIIALSRDHYLTSADLRGCPKMHTPDDPASADATSKVSAFLERPNFWESCDSD